MPIPGSGTSWKSWALPGMVEKVFISAEVGCEKPDPRIFRLVERELGVKPGQVVHVGDSEFHDIAGARAAGWASFLLADRFDPVGGTIGCLGDLLQLLNRG